MPELSKSLSGNRVTKIFINGSPFIKKEYLRERAYIREKVTLETLKGKVAFRVPEIVDAGETDFGRFLTLTWLPGIRVSREATKRNPLIIESLGKAVRELEEVGKAVMLDEASEAFAFRPSAIDTYLAALPPKFDKCRIKVMLDNSLLHELTRESAVLNHRDLREDNLLWDSETKSLGIIDFETACLGPRGGDFGRMLFQDFADPHSASALLNAYSQPSISKQHLNALELLFAVEMLGYLMDAPTSENTEHENRIMVQKTEQAIQRICDVNVQD